MVFEAVKAGKGSGFPAMVFFAGALICAFATVSGYGLFSGASEHWLPFIQAFAGGAILIMLANSMMPESFEHGGKLAGIFTVLGFFLLLCVVTLEKS